MKVFPPLNAGPGPILRARVLSSSALIGVFLAASSPVIAQSVGDYAVYSTAGLPGRLYVPPNQRSASTPRPLVLALHGGGGIGSDNFRHLIDFEGLLTDAKAKGAFLYVPQATSAFWDAANRPELVMMMIDQAIATYNVDPNRIYVTGFSMGGGGAWNLYSRFPDRFAAAVPIAGINPGSGYSAAAIVAKPIWAFHARNDSVVSMLTSRNTVGGILTAANEPVPAFPANNDGTTTFEYENESIPLRYTEWPTGGHSIWFRVYESTALLDWMFAQTIESDPPRITSHPTSATITPGDTAKFLVTAESSETISYQWTKDDVPIAGATTPALVLPNLTPAANGYYRVIVSNGTIAILSRPAKLLVTSPVPGRLVSLSARGRAGSGDRPMIIGFGTVGGSKSALFRGVGPGLAPFGISDPMSDPQLEAHTLVSGADTVLAHNDDWGGDGALTEVFLSAGAFAIDDLLSKDAAMVININGSGTMLASAITGEPGVVLLEMYDLGSTNSQRFTGLSVRNAVGTGDDRLIAGFAVNGNVPKRFAVRGVGPGLVAFGVSDALDDPTMQIHTLVDGIDTVFASNDNWEEEATGPAWFLQISW